ncbi:MAG: vWA domain-containing protein [Polyangiaceae bacterium]
MVNLRLRRLAPWLSGGVLVVVGCGGSPGSQFDKTMDSGFPVNGTLDGSFGHNMITPAGTSSPCVSSVAQAALANANLIVMFDKSGSMGDPAEMFDPKLKWIPVTTAMEAFFSDPSSAGVSASLQFFPQGGDLASVCGYAYGTPLVPLTPLLGSTAFTGAISATMPAGGTPTLPALSGAVSYAQQIAAAHPQDKTLVVLVTDGDPGFGINGAFTTGCMDNDIPHVAAVAMGAKAGTPSIPTYVIGVGSDFTNLNAIASAGGTGQAIIVPVTNPAQTAPMFRSALNTIRSAALPCEFTIPPPPDGQEINPNTVNVIVQGSGGQTVLPFSATCTDMNGWHYDSPSLPTAVQLCPQACTLAQGNPKGVSIAFGCMTASGPPK